ncbi:MAG: hypothetical protein ACW98Y_05985 [Candidatus Thorarchaeota archaeon]|jgi:hypothetical protein
MDLEELLTKLRQLVESEADLPWLNRYSEFGSYRYSGDAEAEAQEDVVSPWLSIIVNVGMSGTTMDPTTDRASGDPYSAHVHYCWIGAYETAPKKVTTAEDLDEWAVFKSRYVREYTDVGVWGEHEGSYVTGLEEDGTLTIREAKGQFQDVDPSEMTTGKTIKLELPK